MAAHNQWGKKGEELAANFLLDQGYRIRHRNWRAGRNELDIVAEKDRMLVVVEVKTRRNDDYGTPEEAVDTRKIRRIVSSTDAYLRRHAIDLNVRFDIITITGDERDYRITHIEEAFFPPLWS